VEFAGGKLIGVKPAGRPAGTTVSVADLFYCMPARRKFLKSDTTELGHIASLVTHYALANPDKHFVLKTPTQEIIHATPVEDMASRVYQIFGRQALEELLEIPAASAAVRSAITEPELECDERAATLTVTGFTSRPEAQRPNRNGIYIFVNRRLVRDRLILHAIHEAYRNIMPPNVFPAVLLFLEIPYEEVDVNVHPAKIEVRFRHPQFVHDFTRDAIRQALTRARPIPSFPGAIGASAFQNAQDEGGKDGTHSSAQSAAAGAGMAGPPRAIIPPPMTMGEAAPGSDGGFDLMAMPLRPEAQRFVFPADAAIGGTLIGEKIAGTFRAVNEGGLESAAALPSTAGIGDLRPLGQVNSSFIVAVNGEGLWIVDQHVAHERVLFEQHLMARRTGRVEGQRLLMPIVVELAPRQVVIFERIAEELNENGFEVEPMGPRSVAIQAAPAGIASADAEKLLTEILDGIERESAAISIDTLQAKIAASTACHAAIKVNMALDHAKMEWLLAQLARTDCPMSCPHGRPVVLRYSMREIEKAFKRI
jgi:DNA mismatch repair protein MutL